MRIDCDSHIFPVEAMGTAKNLGFVPYTDKQGREWCKLPNGLTRWWGPMYYDPKLRINALKDAGFDRQFLTADQGYFPDDLPLSVSSKICRSFNENIAKLQEQHEEFIGIAEIPRSDVDAAIGEAEHSIKNLGLKGIRIAGTWCEKNIEAAEWWPFFEFVNKINVPLVFHGWGLAGGLGGYVNKNVIGSEQLLRMAVEESPSGKKGRLYMVGITFALEAITLTIGMVIKGVLEKYPNLRIGMLECGPSIGPWIASRMENIVDSSDSWTNFDPDGGARVKLPKRPSEYVKKHFWWAIDNLYETTLPVLIKNYGLGSRLLAMTDFPHTEGSLDVIRWIEGMDISQSDKDAIMGKNALQLLNG